MFRFQTMRVNTKKKLVHVRGWFQFKANSLANRNLIIILVPMDYITIERNIKFTLW